MKSPVAASFIILVLFFSSVFQSLSAVRGETQNTSYEIKMSVTYSNQSGENKIWNFTEREDDRTIGLFQNNSWQTVQLTNSTFPIESQENDTDGNPVAVLKFQVKHLIPGENLTFTSTYHVVSKPRLLPTLTEEGSGVLQNISEDLSDKYTKEEGPWQTSNQTLRGLAFALKGSETRVLTIIKGFIVWIKNHISYPKGRHETPYYPNQTYALREGDCDDQAILLITLCRIVGIPSYLQIGGIYLPTYFDNSSYWNQHVSTLERRIGWHGWAIVYIPPWGWLPVDLTYVPQGFGDPLNAIKHGAVTEQNTIQYMNITKSDYVASSRQARDFLTENNFYVYMEDEMTEETNPQNPFGDEYTGWLTAAGLTVAVVVLVTSSLFIISRRLKRSPEGEIPKPQQ